MSRSYKKTARCGDRKTIGKKLANRKVRRKKELYNHNLYKKVYPQYDVCDYNSVFVSFEDYWKYRLEIWYQWGYRYKPYPNKKKVYREWYKIFKSK